MLHNYCACQKSDGHQFLIRLELAPDRWGSKGHTGVCTGNTKVQGSGGVETKQKL